MKKTFRYSVTAGLITAVLASACGLLDDETASGVEVTTDRMAYEPDDTIRLTVANQSDEIVYFLGAGIINLMEIDENDVINEWTVHGFEFKGGSFPIMTGDSVQFKIYLGIESNRKRLGNARLDDSVHYRLDVHLYADKARKQPLPTEHRISNTFTIGS